MRFNMWINNVARLMWCTMNYCVQIRMRRWREREQKKCLNMNACMHGMQFIEIIHACTHTMRVVCHLYAVGIHIISRLIWWSFACKLHFYHFYLGIHPHIYAQFKAQKNMLSDTVTTCVNNAIFIFIIIIIEFPIVPLRW